ncbi:MAG: hypothetical protein JWO08_267 [Verrucomicrobiaceae bacterium]|nr:hypothetical protein [Verrucomicrobiaceae bacterium]
MAYHISRDGTQLGTFTEEEVIEGLEKGEILGSDELWTEGMEEWQPVHEVIEVDEDEEEVTEIPPQVQPVAAELEQSPEPEELEPMEEEDLEVIPPGPEPALEEPAPTPMPVPQPREYAVQSPAQPLPSVAEVGYFTRGPSVTLGQYGTDGTAIASMVLGILSLISGFITGLPAVLCGHMARSTIRRSGGAYSGDGLAVGGLILGYVTSTLTVIWLALLLGGFPVPGSKAMEGFTKERQATKQGAELVMALKKYAEKHNKFPHALEVLGDENVVESERLKQLLAPDLGPSWKGPSGWEYLGSSMPDGNYADRPLLISRAVDAGGHHLVIFQDASFTKAEIQTK